MIQDLKMIHKDIRINFRYLLAQKKTYMILIMILAFGAWSTMNIYSASVKSGIRVAPWVFPEYFSMPVMHLVYGFLTITLFADAPYVNHMSRMVEVRTGRRNWILGQIIYTVELAFLYTFTYLVSSVLFLLPRIYFTTGWGEFLQKASESKIDGVMGISQEMIQTYSPGKAMLYSFLGVWGVTVLMAMLIFFLRMFAGHSAGAAAVGFLTFLSYFCTFIGGMTFGNVIYKVSPVSWIYLYSVDPAMGGSIAVGRLYALCFIVVGVLICSVTGIVWYMRGHEIQE